MTASTDFLPFATGSEANVLDQADYLAQATNGFVANGFSSGVATSEYLNKVWRQSSFVGAGVATYIANTLSVDVTDDGNLSGFVTLLTSAIETAASAAGVSSFNGRTGVVELISSDVTAALGFTPLSTTGTAAAAEELADAVTIQATGDAAWSVSFNGASNVSGALTIQANAVSNSKLAQMPTNTIKGNNTGATANAADLTPSQVFAMLSSGVTQSLGATGYVKLPGGLIIQWGIVSGSFTEGSQTVDFPIAFPTACVMPGGFPINSGPGDTEDFWIQVQSVSASSVTYYIDSGTGGAAIQGFYWFALGH